MQQFGECESGLKPAFATTYSTFFPFLKEPDGVRNFNAATNFWRDVLDEGYMVEVKPVAEVKGVQCNVMGGMLHRVGISKIKVEHRVSRRRLLIDKSPALTMGHNDLRLHAESLVSAFDSKMTPCRRYARKRSMGSLQFGYYIVES